MEFTPLDNPTPELKRLRKALQLNWYEYSNWVDANQQDIALLIATTPLEEEISPTLRAAFIHQHWNAQR